MAFRNLLIISLLIPVFFCSETTEEKLQRIEQQIAEGKIEETKTEVIEWIESINSTNAVALSKNKADRIYAVSPNRTSFYYSESGKLTFRMPGVIHAIAIGPGLQRIIPSFEGTATALIQKKDDRCVVRIVRPVESDSVEEIFDIACDASVAVNDEGTRLYYSVNGNLYLYDAKRARRGLIRIGKSLKSPYKKIDKKMVIRSVSPEELWVFYGSAGYYDLYYYSGRGSDFDLVEKGLASPEGFTAVKNDFLAISQESPQPSENGPEENEESAESDENVAESKPAIHGFEGSPLHFFYTGTAGQYQLKQFTPPDQKGPERNFGLYDFNMVYVAEKEQFLTVRNGELRYMDFRGRTTSLPLEMEKFFLYSEGLAYEDADGTLFLRTSGISMLEKRLDELKDSMSKGDNGKGEL